MPGFHHVELWVADLDQARLEWGWLLQQLGFARESEWPEGESWSAGGAYLTLTTSPNLSRDDHDRRAPGVNHLAFHGGTRAHVDAIMAAAPAHGWTPLYHDRYPHAGGIGSLRRLAGELGGSQSRDRRRRLLTGCGCEDREMASSFTVTTRASVPREQLFDLSLDIDAHLASMSASDERAIGGVTSGAIGLGETVTWRARHFGVWFTMTSRITALDRPARFVDDQTRGPFRSFRHEHVFEDDGDGGTVMTDTLTLASPVFGALAERLILVPYLRRLIVERNRHLVDALDAR